MRRAIIIVLDGCGIGDAPDAKKYQDVGANTLCNLSRAVNGLALPTLEKLGLGGLTAIKGVAPVEQPLAVCTKAIELSEGKDTLSGHFEIAGAVVKKAFKTFPNGFPDSVVERFCKENNIPGVLGNVAASGTEIIQELGREHLLSKKPILYTSADSVFQIACHEEAFGLGRLYELCKSARTICDELGVARVIARPFITKGDTFIRTRNRKDYSIDPPQDFLLDVCQRENIKVFGFGKIPSIYNYKGFDAHIETTDNDDGMKKLQNELGKGVSGLYFINLIDFDMLYGHRRDSAGFAGALERFDGQLSDLLKTLTENDLIIITADHGNDPTFRGTDHTREMIPVLIYNIKQFGKYLRPVEGFYHISSTVFKFLTGKTYKIGKSIINTI